MTLSDRTTLYRMSSVLLIRFDSTVFRSGSSHNLNGVSFHNVVMRHHYTGLCTKKNILL
jgi:hypothetical protein